MPFSRPSLIVLSACVLTLPALADEPWEGTWSDSADPQTCTAERSDGTPLVVMSRDVTPGVYVQSGPDGDEEPKGDMGQIRFERGADPWICYIGKITNVVNLEAWIFDIECGGEGMIWQDRSVIFKTESPPGIAAFNLGITIDSDVVQLFRCPTVDEGLAAADGGDYTGAFKIWLPLAETGDPIAQYNIGVAYATGQGVGKSYGSAKNWFELSAEQGYAPAQNSLGIMYSKGEGLPVDLDVALVWFLLSADQGYPDGMENRDNLFAMMVPAQVASAERTVRSRKEGGGFSSVHAQVQLERGLSIWRDCALHEYDRQKEKTSATIGIVDDALRTCDYLADALIGDLVRIDPRLQHGLLQEIMAESRTVLKERLLTR